ncbi:LytR/AlgR family response regulator transcription factor [Aquimonas sp.]|jgi:DNA-binding LytR/AlgR family response regulator|uniref:LytR/AlgR family response regulator transcription factor n=1 Tax=Aquimonas sp. TaxID=1872588 RepID=UPI0037C0AC06
MAMRPTALIAEDEPLLREALERQLAAAWPELDIVARARNGREAVEQFEALQPAVCFLDVQMPGLSGVEAAQRIGRRAHLVFVTAFDHYAVQAFAQGALDYLVKPVEPARLADTVARLQQRLQAAQPLADPQALLRQLAAHLKGESTPAPLRWIRAQIGSTLRLIPTEDIDYLRADSKYTVVAWRDDGGAPAEALIRLSLKELIAQLDPAEFAQVHRSVVVNLRSISHLVRLDTDSAELHLKRRPERLPVSRSYLHLFRQM